VLDYGTPAATEPQGGSGGVDTDYGVDRVERFLSIFEEEGCRMVELSCADHDTAAANSQFITHLVGRILGQQGLMPTLIDTKGFESVIKLIQGTNSDSFELFYGLYKYNSNSRDTILKMKRAMEEVERGLIKMEREDVNAPGWGTKDGVNPKIAGKKWTGGGSGYSAGSEATLLNLGQSIKQTRGGADLRL
jgi:hypothetical protein